MFATLVGGNVPSRNHEAIFNTLRETATARGCMTPDTPHRVRLDQTPLADWSLTLMGPGGDQADFPRLEDPLPDDELALYLALGWTQCATTGSWPATDRWKALMDAGPPADWLARVHWHLCYLLHDRLDSVHRAGLCQALAAGAADGSRPGGAAAIRILLGPQGVCDA